MPLRTVRILLWLPLIGFLIVLGLVMSGLIRPHSTDIPSQMIGKPLPAFALPPVREADAVLTSASLATGTPHLVNVFASWCIPCAAEAPQLMQLKQAGVPIVGVAISDKVPDTRAFLAQYGDPYQAIGRDDHAAVQLALGSSGVPESFVVDGKGVIRLQHIGDIRPEQIDDILAAVREAGQ
jgi:cytochrome c biogenesis protein CcmG/thiol:disulfide interchange protein DsbE